MKAFKKVALPCTTVQTLSVGVPLPAGPITSSWLGPSLLPPPLLLRRPPPSPVRGVLAAKSVSARDMSLPPALIPPPRPPPRPEVKRPAGEAIVPLRIWDTRSSTAFSAGIIPSGSEHLPASASAAAAAASADRVGPPAPPLPSPPTVPVCVLCLSARLRKATPAKRSNAALRRRLRPRRRPSLRSLAAVLTKQQQPGAGYASLDLLGNFVDNHDVDRIATTCGAGKK